MNKHLNSEIKTEAETGFIEIRWRDQSANCLIFLFFVFGAIIVRLN